MKEQVACLLCDSRTADIFLVGRDRQLDRHDAWQLRRCADCGFIFLSPRPTAEALPDHYPQQYECYQQPRVHFFDDRHAGAGWKGLKYRADCLALANWYGYTHLAPESPGWLTKLLAWWRRNKYRGRILPLRGQGRLLDVGCGTGALLAKHRALGWQATGIERDPAAADQARQLDVHVIVGSEADVDLGDQRFDVIVMMHALEHVPDPVATLRRLAGHLAADGLLIVEVPNARALAAWLFGSWWFAWELPRHFSHFSAGTLARCGRQAGLQPVEHFTRGGLSEFNKSMDYLLPGRPHRTRAGRLALKLLTPVYALLNRLKRGDALRMHFAREQENDHP